jgi:phage recombination protein Bet
MSSAIATREGEVLLSAAEVELVKRSVANGASDDELRLFLHDCRRQGVHPLDKLIHFTKRGGRYTPITSIDFMRMRAADTGELAGNDDPTYVFARGEATIPQSATVTVHRITQGQRFAYTATARWVEYKPPSGQDHMWLKMPQLMLGKCAEALALRKAFPKQLHGIYERAEMAQAGHDEEAPPERPRPIVKAPNPDLAAPDLGPPVQSPLTPLGEEHEALDAKIAESTPSRIAIMMRRFELGDGDWRKLDLASKAMLAKHLERK